MSFADTNTTTKTAATVQALASEMLSWFETKTRESGKRYITLKDGHPEWMQDVCREAHDSSTVGMILPDDHRYQMIAECLSAISEADGAEALSDAAYDLTAPDYTHELLEWLASSNHRHCFCDAYREEFLGVDPGVAAPEGYDFMGIIRDGYLYEMREVYDLVLHALRARLDD